ncbi:MAG: hypothetical protein Q9215_007701 [Flavoplaca cf. flavocitrina]
MRADWAELCQLEADVFEHIIGFRSFVRVFNERASTILHLASLEDQHHEAALMFLEGFQGGKNQVDDLLKETEGLQQRLLTLKNPLKNVGNPGVDETWQETRKQVDELEVTLQDHYFRLKTLRRILRQRSSLLSGLANPTSEHYKSAQQMLRDFVGTAVKVEEFASEIQELRRNHI